MIAIIVGNGASRASFDLMSLKGVAPIYGCNALYRDYSPTFELPDYLVAIDDGIISEIQSSSFPSERLIIPPPNERWEPAECNPNRPRSNAGMNAMREAIRRGAAHIIALGFDFLLRDRNQSVSNIYDGTLNYGPQTRANHHDNFGRVRYLNWLASTNPYVNFHFAFPDGSDTISGGVLSENIYTISFDQLRANLVSE